MQQVSYEISSASHSAVWEPVGHGLLSVPLGMWLWENQGTPPRPLPPAAAAGHAQPIPCLPLLWQPLPPATPLLLWALLQDPAGAWALGPHFLHCSAMVATMCLRTCWGPLGRQLRVEQQMWSWLFSLLLMGFLS